MKRFIAVFIALIISASGLTAASISASDNISATTVDQPSIQHTSLPRPCSELFNAGVSSPKLSGQQSLSSTIKKSTSSDSEFLSKSRKDSQSIYSNFLKQSPKIFAYGQNFLRNLDTPISYSQNLYIKNLAKKITLNAKTKDAKILAVCKYAAKNIYYDCDYANGLTSNLYTKPYDVLKKGYSVCAGYSEACRALLQAVSIPCVVVTSITYENASHAYNAAYNGKKWIFFDSTWCTNNQYSKGKKITGTTGFKDWYNFAYTKNNEIFHIISGMEFNQKSGVLYNFPSYSPVTSFLIPNGVTKIANHAFMYNKIITKVYIPSSMKTIEENAFALCTKLSAAYFYGNAPSLGTNAFARCASNFKIYRLKSSSGFSAESWNDFKAYTFIKPLSIKLSKSSVTLEKGKTYNLKAIINPSHAVIYKVAWKTSNYRIATVNTSGTISAKSSGTGTISAYTVDGNKTAKCTVIIK